MGITVPTQLYVVTDALDEVNPNKTNNCKFGAIFAQASHAFYMGRDTVIFLEASGVKWGFSDYLSKIKKIKNNCFNSGVFFEECLNSEITILACKNCINCTVTSCSMKEDQLHEKIKISTFTSLQKYLRKPCNVFTI